MLLENKKSFPFEETMEQRIEKLNKKDSSLVNENANKDSNIFNTHRDLTAGSVAKTIGLRELPERVRNAHINGQIHYHDLDYTPYSPMSNCSLVDFEYMFKNGFQIGGAKVEPPKSINTATAQMAQVIANVSSSQYGGTSVDRIDELLAPFAKMNYEKHMKDAEEYVVSHKKVEYAQKKTKKDIYDAMQSLEYEINTLFTSNGQTPFVSIGFGLGYDWFEREIQKAIFQIRINGLGSEKKTAIFPKLIFTIKDGINKNFNDVNYDIKQLALECATIRMYPDIVNYEMIKSLTGSFKVPMGCRSFLQGWKNENGKEVNSGRMNLGVVTLNLPQIAIQTESIEDFFYILDKRIDVGLEALEFKLNRTKEAIPKNAPILYKHGAFGKTLTNEDSVDEVFKNKRATISLGYIGLYEVATKFFGPNWEKNPHAKRLTIDIVKEMKRRCDEKGNELGYHFSVYATPSESLTDRFSKIDKSVYGEIKDITDKGYYTNSFHYDIRKKPTPFEKIDFEKDYPQYSSGGFIHYCEYPVLKHNTKALESVWDYSYDKIGYLGTNTPIDKCNECGFAGEFEPTEKGFKCPDCGNTNPETCDVVKRTCGYLGNPQARPMVEGRHKEISARQKHM